MTNKIWLSAALAASLLSTSTARADGSATDAIHVWSAYGCPGSRAQRSMSSSAPASMRTGRSGDGS